MQVKDIPEGMTLVTDSQEVETIRAEAKCFVNVNENDVDSCNAFFVEVQDGEYTKIYGIESSIPKNDELAHEFMSLPDWNEETCRDFAWRQVDGWDHKTLMNFAVDTIAYDYTRDKESFIEAWYNDNKMQ